MYFDKYLQQGEIINSMGANTKEMIKWKQAAFGAVCVTLASQISIGLLDNGFKVSAGVLFLPIFSFYISSFPIFRTAAISAPLVFLLRGLVWCLSQKDPWLLAEDAPEMLFYLAYGFFLFLWLRKVSLHPFRLSALFPIAGIDFLANCVELLVRNDLEGERLLQIALVAIVRTAAITGLLWALEWYGFSVLHREDTQRYQRLLTMTSILRGELAWMQKSASMIEGTMNAAYSLYSRLRESQPDSQESLCALSIAKDIHEVKKEYMLILRGITEALQKEKEEDGMWFSKIWSVLFNGLSRAAQDAGKHAEFSLVLTKDFYTRHQYELLSIFRNLLNNALEAAKLDPVKIRLVQEDDGENWLFKVWDTCGGIPSQVLDKIFLAGFSTKINYETGEINRGLGLSLVRDLVEDTLSGSIRVESKNGETIFFLKIPKGIVEEEP